PGGRQVERCLQDADVCFDAAEHDPIAVVFSPAPENIATNAGAERPLIWRRADALFQFGDRRTELVRQLLSASNRQAKNRSRVEQPADVPNNLISARHDLEQL